MKFSHSVLRIVAAGAPLAAAIACGGMVTRGDTSDGSGNGPLVGTSGNPEPSKPPAQTSGHGSTSAAAVTYGVGSAGAATGWASSGAGSTGSGAGSTSSGAGVGSATSNTSITVQYSQNAPLGSSEVTCYGATDGTSCLVSDINFAGYGPVRSVTCSKATGQCSCVVSPAGAPFSGITPEDNVTATFAFSAGMCPMGSAAAMANVIGALPASLCTAYGEKLFSLCGW